MNHPTQNEWLLYLDGEASPEDANRLREHLERCPMCSAEFAGWKRSIQKLQRMPFPASSQVRSDRRRAPFWASPILKWGLAAAIVLFVGFAFGRLSAMRAEALKQTVAAQVREELRTDLRTALAKTTNEDARMYQEIMQVIQQQRQQDQRSVLALIQGVRERQISDCLALRQDLETAVSMADSDLRQDSSRINQLANTILTTQKH
jgi:hypothetical protein